MVVAGVMGSAWYVWIFALVLFSSAATNLSAFHKSRRKFI